MSEAIKLAKMLMVESDSVARGVKYTTAKKSAAELIRLSAIEQAAQATIDRLTAERDALCKQLEQEQDLGNYEISEIIQKTEGNSMYGRDHNGWLHSLVRAGWTAHVERINNQITKESK